MTVTDPSDIPQRMASQHGLARRFAVLNSTSRLPASSVNFTCK